MMSLGWMTCRTLQYAWDLVCSSVLLGGCMSAGLLVSLSDAATNLTTLLHTTKALTWDPQGPAWTNRQVHTQAEPLVLSCITLYLPTLQDWSALHNFSAN